MEAGWVVRDCRQGKREMDCCSMALFTDMVAADGAVFKVYGLAHSGGTAVQPAQVKGMPNRRPHLASDK